MGLGRKGERLPFCGHGSAQSKGRCPGQDPQGQNRLPASHSSHLFPHKPEPLIFTRSAFPDFWTGAWDP